MKCDGNYENYVFPLAKDAEVMISIYNVAGWLVRTLDLGFSARDFIRFAVPNGTTLKSPSIPLYERGR